MKLHCEGPCGRYTKIYRVLEIEQQYRDQTKAMCSDCFFKRERNKRLNREKRHGFHRKTR